MRIDRILIIDDSHTVRTGLLLRAAPAHAFAVGSLAEADAELHAADTIILDVQLPDGNGLDWLAEKRAAGMQKPVLVISDLDDAQVRHRARKLGAWAVSKKTAVTELPTVLRMLERMHAALAQREAECHDSQRRMVQLGDGIGR